MSASRRVLAVTGACLMCLVLASCADGGALASSAGAPVSDEPVRRALGEPVVPFTTVEDIVSYADAVVAFTVSEEAPEPASTESEQTAEQTYINRLVTLDVEQELWSAAGGEAVPTPFIAGTSGWWLRDGRRVRMALDDSARLEVGRTYFAPVFRLDCKWIVIDAGIVALTSPSDQTPLPADSTGTLLAQQLARAGVQVTMRLLADTPPLAVAQANQALDPDARFQAVLRSKGLTPPYQATPARDC